MLHGPVLMDQPYISILKLVADSRFNPYLDDQRELLIVRPQIVSAQFGNYISIATQTEPPAAAAGSLG